MKENLILGNALCFKHALNHLDPVAVKEGDPFSRHQGIGIRGPYDNAAYAAFHNGIRTGGSLSAVAAWFQRDVEGGAPGRPGQGSQGLPFRVGTAVLTVVSPAYDHPVLDNNRSHQWIGIHPAFPFLGQLQGKAHVFFICHFYICH